MKVAPKPTKLLISDSCSNSSTHSDSDSVAKGGGMRGGGREGETLLPADVADVARVRGSEREHALSLPSHTRFPLHNTVFAVLVRLQAAGVCVGGRPA